MSTPDPATEHLNRLKAFRQLAYERLGPAHDALFELSDAVLLTSAVNSFAELSLCPVFRRRWPSLASVFSHTCHGCRCRGQSSDCKTPTADCRLPTAD